MSFSDSDDDDDYVAGTSDEDEDEDDTGSKKKTSSKEPATKKVKISSGVAEDSGTSTRSVKVEMCQKRTVERDGVEVVEGDYNKKQYCYFCGKRFSKLPRHLETAHEDKEEVKALMQLEVKHVATKERRKAIKKLTNLGNHRNNIGAVKSGKGDLVVAKRPSKDAQKTYRDFYPCPFCVGWYCKEELWRHARERCEFRDDSVKNLRPGTILKEGRALVIGDRFEHPLLAKLLSHLRAGEVATIIQEDELGWA